MTAERPDELDVAGAYGNQVADDCNKLIDQIMDSHASMIADTEIALDGKVNMATLRNNRHLEALDG